MRVYDGESLKETDPRAKTLQEYRDAAGPDEGMDGVSTRFAFKVLAATFNYDTTEIAADPTSVYGHRRSLPTHRKAAVAARALAVRPARVGAR